MKIRPVEFLLNPRYLPYFTVQSRYFVLYGGTDSGKSHFAGQNILNRFCYEKNHRFLFLRKVQNTIKNSQFQVIREVVHHHKLDDLYRIVDSALEIHCPNNNMILAAGLDDPARLKSIHGITGIWIEEPTELNKPDFEESDRRLRGLKRYYKQMILSFNPINEAHFLHQMFFLEPEKNNMILKGRDRNCTVVHSTHRDNMFCDPKDAKKYESYTGYNKTVYDLGEWGGYSDPDQVVSHAIVYDAFLVKPIDGIKVLGCDIARYGDDKTVFIQIDGNILVDAFIEEFEGYDLARISDMIKTRIVERVINADNVGIDGVGLGAGVVDNLKRDGLEVMDIISGAAPIEDDTGYQYLNLRSQMWWHARLSFENKEICMTDKNIKLLADLTTPLYTYSRGKKIQVESKDSIKKRIGRSPDYGDAFVYCNFVRKFGDVQSATANVSFI